MEYKLEILRFFTLKLLNICLNAILAASKRAKHTVLIISPRILIPEEGQSNAP